MCLERVGWHGGVERKHNENLEAPAKRFTRYAILGAGEKKQIIQMVRYCMQHKQL